MSDPCDPRRGALAGGNSFGSSSSLVRPGGNSFGSRSVPLPLPGVPEDLEVSSGSKRYVVMINMLEAAYQSDS